MEDLVKEIEMKKQKLITKHENDPDLNHEIGKDRDCLYCDEYKKLLLKEKKLPKKKTERSVEFVSEIEEKQLYEVVISDGSKFMVYARSLKEVAGLLKVQQQDIKKETVLPKKYWEGIYVETENGSLRTVKQIVTTKRSRIVSKFTLSNNPNVRRYCYNDTPFEYLIYDDSHVERVERFVQPFTVLKTKKFNSCGRISIQTSTGTLGVSPGDVLLKLTKKLFVVLDQTDFKSNFSEEENYVWSEN